MRRENSAARDAICAHYTCHVQHAIFSIPNFTRNNTIAAAIDAPVGVRSSFASGAFKLFAVHDLSPLIVGATTTTPHPIESVGHTGGSPICSASQRRQRKSSPASIAAARSICAIVTSQECESLLIYPIPYDAMMIAATMTALANAAQTIAVTVCRSAGSVCRWAMKRPMNRVNPSGEVLMLIISIRRLSGAAATPT